MALQEHERFKKLIKGVRTELGLKRTRMGELKPNREHLQVYTKVIEQIEKCLAMRHGLFFPNYGIVMQMVIGLTGQDEQKLLQAIEKISSGLKQPERVTGHLIEVKNSGASEPYRRHLSRRQRRLMVELLRELEQLH